MLKLDFLVRNAHRFLVIFLSCAGIAFPTAAWSLSPSGKVIAVVQATTASGPGGNRTCVDAPLNASLFFGQVPACDQMLSCVRPLIAAFTRRGPVWSCADWDQIAYAHFHSAPSGSWFSQSRINDRLPLPVLRSAHIPDTTRMTTALRGRQRIPINATVCHQSPGDPRHFVCKCDSNQHLRLSCHHPRQP